MLEPNFTDIELLLKEYQCLKNIIFDVVEIDSFVAKNDREIIINMVNRGAHQAVKQFTRETSFMEKRFTWHSCNKVLSSFCLPLDRLNEERKNSNRITQFMSSNIEKLDFSVGQIFNCLLGNSLTFFSVFTICDITKSDNCTNEFSILSDRRTNIIDRKASSIFSPKYF